MERKRSICSQVEVAKTRKTGRLLVITGSRQVGKTTLVRKSFADYTYITLDDVVARAGYTSLTASQWHDSFPLAILDEVQKEPQLIDSIKAVFDQYDDSRYVLLGSSQILLLKKVKETLAGRCRILEMFPLTLPEFQARGWDSELQYSYWQQLLSGNQVEFFPDFRIFKRMNSINAAWSHYLTFGGYPALVDEELTDQERYEWLSAYVRTYLERDVRDLVRINDLEPYRKLQQWMALQTGEQIVSSNIAKEIGISTKTVNQYLEYLQLSYQMILLPAWSRNSTKRLVKASKMHFMDFGVQQAVLNKRGGITGHEFESMLIAELYKQAKNIEAPVNFYHLRTHDGMEIDLLVETPDGYYAFEIKQSEHVGPTDARHLRKLDSILDRPLLHAFVLSNDPKTQTLGDRITAISAQLFLG